MTVTATIRNMKPGETITLPAKALTSLMATTLTRLRKEFIVERRDWKVGPQDQTTGEFQVTCFTREL